MQLDKARNRRKEQGVARGAAPRTGKKRRLAATRASGLASELGSPQALSASPGSRSGRQRPAVGQGLIGYARACGTPGGFFSHSPQACACWLASTPAQVVSAGACPQSWPSSAPP